MSKSNTNFSIEVVGTESLCPIGEVKGKKRLAEGKIPSFLVRAIVVLSGLRRLD